MNTLRGRRGAARAVADVDAGSILASVEIAAAPERIFQALASREIVDWWGKPSVFDAREWSGDVRVGANWRASGIGREGVRWELEGKFLEVNPPRKLSHTWNAPGSSAEPSIVTYLLEEIDGGTRVTLRHVGVSDRDSCIGACMGWESSLTQLAARLGALNP
ncbi:MAG: SRPBCC domain-containing protein [Hyphomicrobiales bacterium]|nr:SRPBCC domain-containing protein [Hyphomicrobiales bacterium]MBV8439632.1 SRPBCC domain-containing protein [Hyphomicrobiales bacterium]